MFDDTFPIVFIGTCHLPSVFMSLFRILFKTNIKMNNVLKNIKNYFWKPFQIDYKSCLIHYFDSFSLLDLSPFRFFFSILGSQTT